jgi:hypothetical protein
MVLLCRYIVVGSFNQPQAHTLCLTQFHDRLCQGFVITSYAMCRSRTTSSHCIEPFAIFKGKKTHTSRKMINIFALTVYSQVVPIRRNGSVILSVTCTVHITDSSLVMKCTATKYEHNTNERLVFQTK